MLMGMYLSFKVFDFFLNFGVNRQVLNQKKNRVFSTKIYVFIKISDKYL